MAQREDMAAPADVERHLRALERLPYGPLFFDLTSAVDLRLVEQGRLDLADRLALLEESLAERVDPKAAAPPIPDLSEPGGVGRLLASAPEARHRLASLLAAILPVLGSPPPGELAGRPLVALDPRLTARELEALPLPRQKRIEPSN